jgi:hypothetical protein
MTTNQRLRTVIKLLEKADIILVDDCYYVHSFDCCRSSIVALAHSDDVVLSLSYSDDGLDHEEQFTRENIEDGEFVAEEKFVCLNSSGDHTVLKLFRLTNLVTENQICEKYMQSGSMS